MGAMRQHRDRRQAWEGVLGAAAQQLQERVQVLVAAGGRTARWFR